MPKFVKTILTSMCALMLSCCSDCDDCFTTVTYEVSGTSSSTSVYFHDEYGDMHYRSSIALPWVKKITIQYKDEEYYGGGAPHGFYLAYVSATAVQNPGNVTVKIYVNNEFKAEDRTGIGKSTATARHAVDW